MNIIILGDSNVKLIKEYCENVLTREDNICILSYTNKGIFSDFYKNRGIKEIYVTPYTVRMLTKVNVFQEIYRVDREIGKQLPFDKRIDVMHIHYVEVSTLIYLSLIWLRSKRRVITFWGSDILRISRENKKLLFPFLISASALTFMIQKQYETYSAMFRFFRGQHKIRIIDTGSDILNVLDDVCLKMNKSECKRAFGMLDNRITIHMGYNKEVEQQHLLMLEDFDNLSQTVIDKIQVVFPWQYGTNVNEEEYIKQIEFLCKKRGIEYLFVKDFLSGEKLAMFRNSADLFVYGQTTDAMSDTPLEYLYIGSFFLCPQWLEDNYKTINKNKRQCITYSGFQELSTHINELVLGNKFMLNKSEYMQIKKEIYESKSWEKLAWKWRKCYEKK